MQESPFYEHVMQRGIEQGIQQGARQMSIDNTLAILEAHFPEADINPIKNKLQTITDIEKLKQINRNALYANLYKTSKRPYEQTTFN